MAIKIGLEVHCQLNTRSKLFCGCATAPQGPPNTDTCPVCLGFPGYKPVLNRLAVEHVIRIGCALGSSISGRTFFSRKTYFYPDMSKNYQITQYELPIAVGGHLDVGESRIGMTRVHLEEDPARILYANGNLETTDYVLIDYNRSGTPLAEIVTEPDIKSPAEARAFLEKLSNILEYIGAYDPSREMSLRVDVNISTDGGERVEIKNITGFENVEKALMYESVRQANMVRMGARVERETRHFDDKARTTRALRKKEYEEDYGYIFDPDLPLLRIAGEWVSSIASSMPELPDRMAERFASQYRISPYEAKVLVYAGKDMAEFFEASCRLHGNAREVSRWTINYLMKSLNWRSERVSRSKVRPETFVELLRMIDSNAVTERFAKELIKEYVDTGEQPSKIAAGKAVSLDDAALMEIVKKVVKENGKAFEELKGGKAEAKQYLLGKVLRETRSQADPKKISAMIDEIKNASVAQ